MNLETLQNWFHEFWKNIRIDMNFGSLNRIEMVLVDEVPLCHVAEAQVDEAPLCHVADF
jgi:hypothetical protein